MSKNNKNAKRISEAKEMGKIRKGGGKGPAKTTPKHGKVNVKWKSNDAAAARVAILIKTKDSKTVLEKLKNVSE